MPDLDQGMRDGVNITKPGVGGAQGKGFCKAPHPTNGEVWCRRLPHDDITAHRAFSFSISEPEEW